MAANYGGQQSNDGLMDMLAPVILIAAGFIILWAIWALHHEVIISILFSSVRWISLVGQHIPWAYPSSMSDNFVSWGQTLHLANPKEYGWDAAKIMIGVIAHTLSFVVFPWLLLRVVSLSKGNVTNRFVRNFNLDMLAKRNAQYYAAISPILGEDLINTPIHQGPWAIARAPMDYCLEQEMIFAVQRRHESASRLASLIGGKEPAEGSGDRRKYIKG